MPFFRKKRPLDSHLESEIHFHIEKSIEEKIAAGKTAEDARRETMLEFGGREQVKEELRDVHRIVTLDHIVANIKSGLRLMRKSPSFSAAVILTLALGIGANSAVFSAINAILLRPLPFPNGDELMVMRQLDRKSQGLPSFVAPVRLEDWNRLNSTFSAISGYYTQDVSETSGQLPEKITEALVAPRSLQVWGIAPALGRDFTAQEEHFGGPNGILISDRLWRRRFDANPNAIGQRLRMEGYSYTIVGVMPAAFLFPIHDVDVWYSDKPDAPYAQSRDSTWFTVIGRLKPGVTIDQARANLSIVQSQLGRQFPKTDAHLAVDIQPLKTTTIGGAGRSLWILFGAVSLLLLIACTNIAALLLARTAEREREISVRFSLGASRSSIIAQLLTECFLLALAGSALGLLVAASASRYFRSLAASLPRAEEISLDWRILVYTLACAIAVTLLSGLFPAIRGTRRDLTGELARASRSQVSTRSPLQWLLAGVQVALAVTLLVGSGLLLRSFQELGRVSPGFDPSHVLTLRISANWGETVDLKTLTNRIDRTLDSLRAVPGIRAAATSAALPGVPGDARSELRLVERSTPPDAKILADSRFVSQGYFATMQIPVLAGEPCRASSNTTAVLINRSFEQTYLRGSQPVGNHIAIVPNPFNIPPAEIRGIVGDAREQGLGSAPIPSVYWCISAPNPSPWFLIRTQSDPALMAETIRRRIHTIDPARSVYDVSPLTQHLSNTFAEDRLRTLLLTLFALTAIALACIGLYGTLSYFVTVRKREIGLRLALGAVDSQIVARFLFQAIAVTILGCAVGLGLALLSTRALSGMLYGVSASDPRTFVIIPLLVVMVATAASVVPACRAARVDPMQVLRDE